MKAKDERIIKRTLDPANLPKLSVEQQAMLNALVAKPDNAIDYSDAEATPADVQWHKAAQKPLYRPVKQSTTVRLDADVLVWLKSKGHGYQTRINAILRQSMLQELEQQSHES